MMIIRRAFSQERILLWLSCMLTLLFLLACTAPETPAPTPTTPPEPTIDGPVVIPFFTTESDPKQIQVLQELIAEYQNLNPDIEIDIILASPASRERRLLTALASGADLGIFEIEPTLMTEWADSGYLLPLDDVVVDIGEDDYVAGSLFRHGGQVYAIPYATSVYGLWVRTDLLAREGLSLPKDYDAFYRAIQQLTHNEVYGIALPGGQNIASVNYFSIFLWQNGGDYFTCDGELAFDSPQALNAVEKWAAVTRYAPPGFTVWGYREQIDAFLRGRVAMAIYAGRLGVTMAEQAPELEERVALIFPPLGPEQVTLGVWSRFAIAAGTRYKKEAKAFLKWLLQGDRLLRYTATVPGHMIPPLHSVQPKLLAMDDPYVMRHADWIQQFQQWVPRTNHPAMNMGSMTEHGFIRSSTAPPWAPEVFGVGGVVDTMLQEISLGQAPPDQAWRSAVDRMDEVIENWKSQHPEWRPPPCPSDRR